VKVVDPSGATLPVCTRHLPPLSWVGCRFPLTRAHHTPQVAWEKHATAVVNARGGAALAAALLAALQDTAAGPGPSSAPATVLVARDTRPSGPALMAAVMAGAAALGAAVHDLGASLQQHHGIMHSAHSPMHCPSQSTGELTTPSLHLAVYDTAAGQSRRAPAEAFDAHVQRLAGGYASLMAHAPPPEQPGKHVRLVLDCANGVGAAVAAAVGSHPAVAATGLAIHPVNTSRSGLNARCGADFVQKRQRMPGGAAGVGASFWGDGDVHWASLDGDADRLVYFHPQGQPPAPGDEVAWPLAQLLDGDKTMCLLATHCAALIRVAGLADALLPLAAVQTAYANGGSTAYMRSALGGDVAIVTTPTGVKHLHAAAEHHDVALYWEANGHGAMVFSARARAAIQQASSSGDASAAAAASQLAAMERVTNPAVGDGLSAVLLVEAVLACRRMSVAQWSALYSDLPCCHTACRVKDRSAVKTAPGDERLCVAPPGLQDAVDAAVAGAGPSARAFVRASGTEDLVRVYAEAATQPAAEQLARLVARAVHALAHGVGDAA
jgi:phosphoacetylglucosamine mutase